MQRISKTEWHQRLDESEVSSIFMTFEWNEICEQIKNVIFIPTKFRINRVDCCIPLFKQDEKFSLGFMGYSNVLTPVGIKIPFCEIKKKLHAELIQLDRVLLDTADNRVIPNESLLSESAKTGIITLTSDYGIFQKSITGSARTGVRYSHKRGVLFRDITFDNSNDLASFYVMYEQFLKQKSASYTLPCSFFKSLDKTLTTHYKVYAAHNETGFLGFSVFLFDKTTCYYWIHVNNLNGKKLQVGYALLDLGIQEAIRQKKTFMDLGSSNNQGILNFKSHWNPIEKSYVHWRRQK